MTISLTDETLTASKAMAAEIIQGFCLPYEFRCSLLDEQGYKFVASMLMDLSCRMLAKPVTSSLDETDIVATVIAQNNILVPEGVKRMSDQLEFMTRVGMVVSLYQIRSGVDLVMDGLALFSYKDPLAIDVGNLAESLTPVFKIYIDSASCLALESFMHEGALTYYRPSGIAQLANARAAASLHR